MPVHLRAAWLCSFHYDIFLSFCSGFFLPFLTQVLREQRQQQQLLPPQQKRRQLLLLLLPLWLAAACCSHRDFSKVQLLPAIRPVCALAKALQPPKQTGYIRQMPTAGSRDLPCCICRVKTRTTTGAAVAPAKGIRRSEKYSSCSRDCCSSNGDSTYGNRSGSSNITRSCIRNFCKNSSDNSTSRSNNRNRIVSCSRKRSCQSISSSSAGGSRTKARVNAAAASATKARPRSAAETAKTPMPSSLRM